MEERREAEGDPEEEVTEGAGDSGGEEVREPPAPKAEDDGRLEEAVVAVFVESALLVLGLMPTMRSATVGEEME
jgi:hypothetical protein